MEILSAMLRKAEKDSLFTGIRISRGAPSISHLFFANDSLLFLQVTPEACDNLAALLSEFCSLSGQVINLQKSFVKFSPNIPWDYREYLARSLQLQSKPSLGSYLGFPVELGRSKVAEFGFLIDKVVHRLSAFASLGLSAAAKLVIINSVLVASFNHILSVFRVPSSICSKVDNLLARFWWKSDPHSKGLALRSKSLLHLPRGMGGLSIRRLESFNSVLLARQCWRIHHHPQLLISKLLSAKYPSFHLSSPRRISGASWGCQGLVHGLSVLSEGVAWKVGSGTQVRILQDSWVPGEPVLFRDNCETPFPSHVSSIINLRSYAWDTSLVHQLFDSSTAHRILAQERPSRPMDDFVYWNYSKDGTFSTKSAYAMLLGRLTVSHGSSDIPSSWWQKYWGLPLLPKLHCFGWKLLHNALPLGSILRLRGIPVDSTCVFCLQDQETQDHLFLDCPFISNLWSTAPNISSLIVCRDYPFSIWVMELVTNLRHSKSWETLVSLFSFFWSIWIARNHKVFRQAVISPALVLHFMQDWVTRSSAAQDFRGSFHASRIFSGPRCGSTSTSSLSYLHGDSLSFDALCLVFDGAFDSRDFSAWAGWIFRHLDSDRVIGGGARAFLASSALHSELQTCLWALKVVSHRGFDKLVLYTDCSNLVTYLRAKDNWDISCIWLLQEIRNLLGGFNSCAIRKVPRRWVAPAHWLALQARQRRLLLWSF
ncbi:uncharacterized protein LOC110729176 [Chenopodium quinoa]|uniref:uncharacterized protein LOC110729176 n=1 Tax=Chenopodium quinoa TaxID=63459 RepID=UPI000B78E990|nr:uncharacterized protein LOC110729176 [Chenopodium quinoa]